MSTHAAIINVDELDTTRELRHGERFDATLAPVGQRIGARKLGYNVTSVAPGKRAFPFHNHHVNEEMFFILEGEGRLRLGAAEHPVRKGDFICCPAGGEAHQLVNTGPSPLRYLAVSTMIDCDVWQYPDAKKFGVIAGRDPSGTPGQATFPSRFIPDGVGVDYWQGE
jgi:uncharacterized cupin superfamily protein